MSSHTATLYGANLDVLSRATDWPRSKASGAVLLPFCWLAALISSWLAASGCAELALMPYLSEHALMIARKLAQSGGRAITLSSPSFLAAATRASIPPKTAAEVASLTLTPEDVRSEERRV